MLVESRWTSSIFWAPRRCSTSQFTASTHLCGQKKPPCILLTRLWASRPGQGRRFRLETSWSRSYQETTAGYDSYLLIAYTVDVVKKTHLSLVLISQKKFAYIFRFGCELGWRWLCAVGGIERLDPSLFLPVVHTAPWDMAKATSSDPFDFKRLFVYLTFRLEMATGTRPTSFSRPRTQTYSP